MVFRPNMPGKIDGTSQRGEEVTAGPTIFMGKVLAETFIDTTESDRIKISHIWRCPL